MKHTKWHLEFEAKRSGDRITITKTFTFSVGKPHIRRYYNDYIDGYFLLDASPAAEITDIQDHITLPHDAPDKVYINGDPYTREQTKFTTWTARIAHVGGWMQYTYQVPVAVDKATFQGALTLLYPDDRFSDIRPANEPGPKTRLLARYGS